MLPVIDHITRGFVNEGVRPAAKEPTVLEQDDLHTVLRELDRCTQSGHATTNDDDTKSVHGRRGEAFQIGRHQRLGMVKQ
jgi:hypothetical protein